jgi:hypothetical protein
VDPLNPTLRNALAGVALLLLVLAGITAVTRAGDEDENVAGPAPTVATTAPTVTEPTSEPPTTAASGATTTVAEEPAITTPTTGAPSGGGTPTTAPASGLAAGGAGMVPQDDDSARTGIESQLMPGLALVGLGIALRHRLRPAR